MKIYRIAKDSDLIPSQIVAELVESLHHTYDDILEGDVLQRVQKYEYYRLVDFPINDLDLEEWNVEEDRVEDYIKQTKDNSNYPPIVVDTGYGFPSIIDGIHRANAVAALGHSFVKAYVPVIKNENI